VPSRNMASNSALAMASRSGARRRGRQVTGGAWRGPDVVYDVVPYLALNSGGTGELRELGDEVVYGCATTDDFDAGHRRSCGLGRCEQ
jgi:hypothetical protein